MKLTLGIDAGGTYTDAVLIDPDSGQVRAKAKALTMPRDLSIGIAASLDGMDVQHGSTEGSTELCQSLRVCQAGVRIHHPGHKFHVDRKRVELGKLSEMTVRARAAGRPRLADE